MAAIAKMKTCRGQNEKQDAGITPLSDILSGDWEEEPYPSLNWEEPYAYRLNHEGKPEPIPIAEWRVVCLKIEPLKTLAESEEDKIGIEGAKREEWHFASLKKIPDDAFMWKADLEKIYPADKLNYKVFIEEPYKAIVQQAFDRLIKGTTGISTNGTALLPRREFYTISELAEYWRDELGIKKATDSLVTHYVNEGMLKTSLRYEWPDGRGWFFEEFPGRTNMIGACKTPPVEKHYIRLQEAERFENALSWKIESNSLPPEAYKGDVTTFSSDRQEPAQGESMNLSSETPEEYADRRRKEGVRKEIIAYELKYECGYMLQGHQIARLVAPDKKYTDAQEKAGNPRKTGERWAKKGKELKEMTSS
jgi:hypothetical protein